MSSPLTSAARFWSTAAEQGFVSSDSAASAQREASGDSPISVALARGLMSAEQCDIVGTLLRPLDVAPGYEIVGLLGYGGMGVVYRARQINLDRIVALKTILLHQLGQQSATQRFEQEAVAIGRLVHPHIVAAHDFGRHAGRLFLAMELVEGIDADTWIARQGPASEACAWHIARQAAAGLAHAASHGVVHRDMKPANLLLVAPPAGFPLPPGLPMVKIADFGLAVFTQGDELRTRLTNQGSAVGSLHYMAPEQLSSAQVDHRADIYALGASVYHLLAGSAPWSTLSTMQILTKKVSSDPPSLHEVRPEVSAATVELLAAMMHCKPAERPATYDELLDRIDGVLAHLPEAASSGFYRGQTSHEQRTTAAAVTADFKGDPTRTPAPRRHPRGQGRRWLIAGGGVVMLMLLAGLWPWLLNRQPHIPRDLQPRGDPLPLFNGQSLNPPNWRIEGGQWAPKTTEEDGFVLEGNAGGVIARRLPLAHYRLQVVARLSAVSGAEMHFDLPPTPSATPRRYVLRVEPGRALLGRAEGDAKPMAQIHATHSLAVESQQPHEIEIERHSQGWWVLVDREAIGSVPHLHATPAPEFRLKATGAAVLFFDLNVQGLE